MTADKNRSLQLYMWNLDSKRNREDFRFLFLAEVYLKTSYSINNWNVGHQYSDEYVNCDLINENKYKFRMHKELIEKDKAFWYNFDKAKKRIPILNKLCGLNPS